MKKPSMSREKAIVHGKEQLEVFSGEHAEFIKLAIEALQKEPCEDSVSRDVIRLKMAEIPKYTDGKKLASIRHLNDFLEKELEEPIEVTQDMCIGFTMALECIEKFIKDLPSANPVRKKGHWIMTNNYLTAAYGSIDYVKCSCCGDESLEEGDYCPNCGADMKESENE